MMADVQEPDADAGWSSARWCGFFPASRRFSAGSGPSSTCVPAWPSTIARAGRVQRIRGFAADGRLIPAAPIAEDRLDIGQHQQHIRFHDARAGTPCGPCRSPPRRPLSFSWTTGMPPPRRRSRKPRPRPAIGSAPGSGRQAAGARARHTATRPTPRQPSTIDARRAPAWTFRQCRPGRSVWSVGRWRDPRDPPRPVSAVRRSRILLPRPERSRLPQRVIPPW